MKLVIIQIIFIAKYTVSKQNKFIFNLMLVLNIIYHRKASSKLCNKIWKRNFIYTVRLTVLGTLFKEDDFENAKGFCDVIPIIWVEHTT